MGVITLLALADVFMEDAAPTITTLSGLETTALPAANLPNNRSAILSVVAPLLTLKA